jgi:hypothetical protein
VRALVTPTSHDVSSVYNKLIVWGATRGSVGITPDRYSLPCDTPARLPVRARIGASSDTLDVWAVQVNVIVGGLSEDQEELDANAVSVHVNSDDNNGNGTADMNESNDVLGLGVAGEDDLVPVGIDLQPRGVPVGTLALALPSGGHFAACGNDDKSGGRLNPASWALDAGQPPFGFALEGLSVTGPQSLGLQYRLGTTVVSEDSVKIQCVEHPAAYEGVTAGSFLRMYTTRSIGGGGGEVSGQSMGAQSTSSASTMSTQPVAPVFRGQAVGGVVMETLIVNLPPRSYVMADGAEIRFARDIDPENIYTVLPVHFNGGAWYHYVPGVPPDEWDYFVDENGSSNIGRPYSQPSYTVRDYGLTLASPMMHLFTTDMPVPPGLPFNGANDNHTVSMISRFWDEDPELGPFTREELTTLPICVLDLLPDPVVENGPRPTPYSPRNVVISSVETSAGNPDYLAYDPDPESPSDHHRPFIKFTVEDAGDPNQYQYFIFLQPTGASGFTKLVKEGAYAWMVGELSGPGPVTATWHGWKGVPQDDPTKDVNGEWTDKAAWGTYTFDVGVISSDGDWFYYKWPYCLSIGVHGADILQNGELFEMRAHYNIADYAKVHSYPIYKAPKSVVLWRIDGSLTGFLSKEQGGNDVGVDYMNILMDAVSYYTDSPYDGNRMLLTGIDECWRVYRRDHENSIMLTVNDNKMNPSALKLRQTRHSGEVIAMKRIVKTGIDINGTRVTGWKVLFDPSLRPPESNGPDIVLYIDTPGQEKILFIDNKASDSIGYIRSKELDGFVEEHIWNQWRTDAIE